ncbi:VOC family protein [Archangium violaceum]|uniref:VOC family protein n=1 Tax=Archangium violaceum TaxID=83451 RepID=UPI0019522C60|nr:VOC family protein [Archangium violaceum]QRN95440.1 VOC family protein [Archangium violaceum]
MRTPHDISNGDPSGHWPVIPTAPNLLKEMAMRLNHLDLFVSDVPGARDFFEAFLGFRCETTKGRDAMSILRDESGFVLVLSQFRKDSPTEYPTDFHIGFLQETEQAVRALHERLTAAGVENVSPLDQRRGALLFYFRAPGGVLVEISWRP